MVTNADGERRRLYPSLPTPKPLAQPEPKFRINSEKPAAPIPAPTATKKKQTFSPLLPNSNDSLSAKKKELCSLFTKLAIRRMQKEMDDALAANRAPDYHYAILRACDQAEIITKDSEIRQLRIQPNGNMAEDNMLEQIFKYIFRMPST